MRDSEITELYWRRDEAAITQSKLKYGAYCRAIAVTILGSPEDADECVSDTWLSAWNSIPPARPARLSAFLGRITRNRAIDRYRRDRAVKRAGGELPLCLDELSECIGEETPIGDRLALKEALNAFLRALPERGREIFLLRYWYLLPVGRIAARYRMTEGAVRMSLSRTREKLREYLDKEGFGI